MHAAYRMLRNDIYQLISVVGVCVCGRIPEGVGEIWLSFYLWEYVEFCLEKGDVFIDGSLIFLIYFHYARNFFGLMAYFFG